MVCNPCIRSLITVCNWNPSKIEEKKGFECINNDLWLWLKSSDRDYLLLCQRYFSRGTDHHQWVIITIEQWAHENMMVSRAKKAEEKKIIVRVCHDFHYFQGSLQSPNRDSSTHTTHYAFFRIQWSTYLHLDFSIVIFYSERKDGLEVGCVFLNLNTTCFNVCIIFLSRFSQ